MAVKDKIVLSTGEEYDILSVDNDSHGHHVKVFAKKLANKYEIYKKMR